MMRGGSSFRRAVAGACGRRSTAGRGVYVLEETWHVEESHGPFFLAGSQVPRKFLLSGEDKSFK